MINTLSKGQVKAGKFIGAVAASAGEIGSSEIAAGAVLTTHITAGEVRTTHILAGEILTTHVLAGELRSTHIQAGEILTTHILAGELRTTHIQAGELNSSLHFASWSTLSNTSSSIATVTLPDKNGGYALTLVGSSQGMVVTSSGLSDPVAGDFYDLFVVTTPSTIPIHIQSTSATFDGTNKNILMNAVNDQVRIEALSATRWLMTQQNSVTVTGTT